MEATSTLPQVTREFITAGKAIFTVKNPAGERYTFKVTKAKEDGSGRKPCWFVAVFTGSANESESAYTYAGLLDAATGGIITTRGSRFAKDSVPVKVAAWAMRHVWAGQQLPAGYTCQHEGRCGRCGRLLTVPESITSGFGPECSALMGLPFGLPVDANGLDSVDRGEIATGVQ